MTTLATDPGDVVVPDTRDDDPDATPAAVTPATETAGGTVANGRDDLDFDQPEAMMRQSMVLLSIVRHGWTGSFQLPKNKVSIAGEDGLPVEVDSRKIRKGSLVLNYDPGFRSVESIGNEVERLKNIYSVRTGRDARGNTRLVPMAKYPELFAKLSDLKRRRREAVREHLVDRYEEWTEAYRSDFPPGVAAMIMDKRPFPARDELLAAYDIDWHATPILAINPDDFDLSELDEQQKMEFVADAQGKMRRQVEQSLQEAYEQVFGEVVELCDQIAAGRYIASGKAQGSSVQVVLDALERVRNFGGLATPEILRRVEEAQGMLSETGHAGLNRSASLRQAVGEAFGELRRSIRDARLEERMARGGRGRRGLDFAL